MKIKDISKAAQQLVAVQAALAEAHAELKAEQEAAEGLQKELKNSQVAQRATEKRLEKHLDRERRFDDILKEALSAIEPWEGITAWQGPKSLGNQPVGLVVKISDWQIGEVIDPRETEGFGKYNFAEAEKRAYKLVDKVCQQADMYRKAGFVIDQLNVFSEADLLSGNIHYELEVTNEWPLPIAIEKAATLFAEVIHRFTQVFPKVKIWEMCADNHGRLTRKNQAKQGALNNFSRVTHSFANALLGEVPDKDIVPGTHVGKGRVEIVQGLGVKLLATVQGKRFLISHGHEVMGAMGIPYYGMERSRAREAVKRQNTDHTFDYVSIGHWHVPSIIAGNILVNGCLSGTTEYDHMSGRHAGPQQVSFLVDPKHGLFGWTAWKLD